jgi:Fur family ferric uptake transcriptional regulator
MKTRRNTIQRRVLLEEIRKSRRHLTAAELYETVRDRLPRISLGTVYRNLEILTESGEVSRLGVAGHETRFDGVTERHPHYRCRVCGRIDDAEGTFSVQIEADIAAASGWELGAPSVEFEGVCPACRASTGARPEGTRPPGDTVH